MKSTSILHSATVLLLFKKLEQVLAICDEKYVEAYGAETAESLVCEPFAGDPTLHAVAFGCNSVPTQDAELPAGVISQSFTQKCVADVGDETTFNCYELANTTDYSVFMTAAADSNLQCTEGDEFEAPLYMYLESTGAYEVDPVNGDQDGSQSSEGAADSVFNPDLALGAFYAVTIKEIDALQTNPPDVVEEDGPGGMDTTNPPDVVEDDGPGGMATNVTDDGAAEDNTEEVAENGGGEEIQEGADDTGAKEESSGMPAFQGTRSLFFCSVISVYIIGTYW